MSRSQYAAARGRQQPPHLQRGRKRQYEILHNVINGSAKANVLKVFCKKIVILLL